MFRLLREVLTKSDNRTFDEIKVAGFIAINFACAMVAYRVVWMNDQFDAYSFLVGLAWALGAMAGGPAVRDRLDGDVHDGGDRHAPPPGRQL